MPLPISPAVFTIAGIYANGLVGALNGSAYAVAVPAKAETRFTPSTQDPHTVETVLNRFLVSS